MAAAAVPKRGMAKAEGKRDPNRVLFHILHQKIFALAGAGLPAIGPKNHRRRQTRVWGDGQLFAIIHILSRTIAQPEESRCLISPEISYDEIGKRAHCEKKHAWAMMTDARERHLLAGFNRKECRLIRRRLEKAGDQEGYEAAIEALTEAGVEDVFAFPEKFDAAWVEQIVTDLSREDAKKSQSYRYMLLPDNWEGAAAYEPEMDDQDDDEEEALDEEEPGEEPPQETAEEPRPAPAPRPVSVVIPQGERRELSVPAKGVINDLPLEIRWEPVAQPNGIFYRVSAANKAVKEGTVSLQAYSTKLRDIQARIIVAFRGMRNPKLRRDLTPEEARQIADALERREEHLDPYFARLADRSRSGRLTFQILLLAAGDTVRAQHAGRSADARVMQREQGRRSSCPECGLRPEFCECTPRRAS
ncbi:MAG TPA: hypothetical protein VJ732_07360 [Bryobacteraceae bacterium]|nr:hypothetical protein [Bryobacteraceae bacterium]